MNESYDLDTNTYNETDTTRELRFNLRLRQANYPTLHDQLELGDFTNNLDTVKKFFTARHNKDHLLLAGKEYEKNLLALAIVKRYLNNYDEREACVISFPELYLLLTQSWSDTLELDKIQRLKRVDLLCILDCDLPINKDNNNTLKLIELLQYRQNFRKTMLITTTLLKTDFINYYKLYSEVFVNLVYRA